MFATTLAALVLLSRGLPAEPPPLTNAERGLLQHAREELKSKEAPRRQAAAEALGEIGPKMRDAIPDLWTALLDPSPRVRAAVGAALIAVDPEFGGTIGSLALNSNIDALRDFSKLGDRSSKLRPILLDVIGRMAPTTRRAGLTVRIGPSTKLILANSDVNPIVECFKLVTEMTKQFDPEIWRITIALMRFDNHEYVCKGRTAKQSCEEVRKESAIAFRGMKRPELGKRPIPPKDPARPSLSEAAAQDEWQDKRRRLVLDPVAALIGILEKDGPANRAEAIQTLETFTDPETEADVIDEVNRLESRIKNDTGRRNEITAFRKRLLR